MSILNVHLPETDVEIFAQMVDRKANVVSIVQQIRLCRLKLGSVLNRLENYQLGPDALKQVGDRMDEVSNEIRLLTETIQR